MYGLPRNLCGQRWLARYAEKMPYQATILADSVNVGDLGIQVLGILWLIAPFGFTVSGVGVLARLPWWATMIAAVFSFLLYIKGWPDSGIGVLANVGIVTFLLVDSAGG
jgi:hypothetical protein